MPIRDVDPSAPADDAVLPTPSPAAEMPDAAWQTDLFFAPMPLARPLYDAFYEQLTRLLPTARARVQKTQITFFDGHVFACASLPLRRVKGRPRTYLIVTFGLPHQLDSPRIEQAVEPYPGRWTHHVVVETAAEIDEELMAWVRQAHDFALFKGRKKR